MMYFILFFTVLVIQRVIELIIAKTNEKWMKENGAIEYGQNHYKFMVFIHFAFFVSLLIEGGMFHTSVHSQWPLLLSVFILTQIGRIWVIFSLGRYWNTKIIVLPNANVVSKGPFKYFKHPNYVIVTIELVIIPLLFNAYWTLCIFALLNQIILAIRIPLEERALKSETNYDQVHFNTKGWIPMFKKEK